MDFNAKKMDLKLIDGNDSTKREKARVTITHPEKFRSNLGSLKDRLFTQFNTVQKPRFKNDDMGLYKSRNMATAANTVTMTALTDFSIMKSNNMNKYQHRN
jgi:hypothetical protein